LHGKEKTTARGFPAPQREAKRGRFRLNDIRRRLEENAFLRSKEFTEGGAE